MNTAVARSIALPRTVRAAIPATCLRVLHVALSFARTAWEGACGVSKASLMAQQDAERALRRQLRRF